MQIIFMEVKLYVICLGVFSFVQSSYEVLENVGLDNVPLIVCINIFDLNKERTVKITTVSGTAQGKQF